MLINKKRILEGLNYSLYARLSAHALSCVYPNAIFIEDKKTDTQCYVNVENQKIIIAFRGTQQINDWLTDINAVHMVYPYGNLDTDIMVHRGFMMAYLSVRGKIHSIIKDIPLTYKVEVYGHSLGGSLALLCAVDIQYNFKFNIECYVSGNPMVGNKAFVKSYNKRVPNTIRTFMRNDIVPTMPPDKFENECYGGYAHVDTACPIGPRNFLIGIISWFKRKIRSKSILDVIFNHDISLYRENVEKYVK